MCEICKLQSGRVGIGVKKPDLLDGILNSVQHNITVTLFLVKGEKPFGRMGQAQHFSSHGRPLGAGSKV